jgi:ribosomal protein S18 acetylase RimI-like enzyme
VIDYRSFRNDDPPALVRLWNACFTGRGAARLRSPTLLEYFIFAKPYFDPAGLIVAEDDGRAVGFAHAGFGPTADGGALCTEAGVTCMLGVLPDYRRRGIGGELLRRCEAYLRGRGARELYAGPLSPLNPFTFGLYGGGQSAGFLESDPEARPFLERHGYRAVASRRVFQRLLNVPVAVADGRFPACRLHYELPAGPYHGATWWQECVTGPLELHEFSLQDRASGQKAARVVVWEMETFSRHPGVHSVGVVALDVVPERRRQGLAKFLLAQLLRHLVDQFFSLIEAHTAADDEAAMNLLRGLGFAQVDTGHQYRREPDGAA